MSSDTSPNSESRRSCTGSMTGILLLREIHGHILKDAETAAKATATSSVDSESHLSDHRALLVEIERA
jgi:hypothetical protein